MAGDREPEASRRSPHGSACGFANLRYRAIRFVRRHSARIHSPILSFATQTCDCVHVFRVLLGTWRQGSNFLSVRCFGPVTSRPLLGALSLLCRHAMAAHKLRIACVVTLAMLGFGRYVQAASLTLAWDHSTSSNTAGYLVSYGTQSGKYTATVKAGYVTSVSITGLTDGTTYYFIVQSYDSAGTLGSPSPEISGKVPAAVPALSISCPSPVLTSPDGNSISVTLTPTISGGVAPVSTSCSPASGSKFSVGTTSFSCTAVDAAQQKSSCTSTVVVTGAESACADAATRSDPEQCFSCLRHDRYSGGSIGIRIWRISRQQRGAIERSTCHGQRLE